MKRWKTTLIVLGIFAALLTYVLLVEVKREPPAEKGARPTPHPILEIGIDDLQAIRVSDGERVLRIAREGSGWRITEPGDGLADTYTVFMPVDDLINLDAELVVLDQVSDLAAYGLDPVALTLIIDAQPGKEEIYVGRHTPDESAFYVQREGDPRLYTVTRYKIQPFFDWLLDPPYQPTPTPTSD